MADRPLSRVMPCPDCKPHELHFLVCDRPGCDCHDVPVPGVYTD